MHTYIDRLVTQQIKEKLKINPVVAILGPRQCGKSTLAKAIIRTMKNVVFLDLERPSHLNQLNDPELFFSINKNNLICLDEIQRAPSLFPVIRSIVDDNQRQGQFLVLGSASPALIRQSAESLAGRIAYVELSPLLLPEIMTSSKTSLNLNTLWLRGGFPRSLLVKKNAQSLDWRMDFIRTFLEQDIPTLGIKIPSTNLHRFWRMFAHLSGQILNSAKLATSLGICAHTVRHYIDILQHTYMLRVLEPYVGNLKKRLIKSPKIYIRDTGILHALLEIESINDLLAHPIFGASWESLVVEHILSLLPKTRAYFYRNSNGNEIDLILEYGQRRIAVECKAASAPKVERGFQTALDDLKIHEAWIIAPVKESYPYDKRIQISSLPEFITRFI